jgi:hypothetical protein
MIGLDQQMMSLIFSVPKDQTTLWHSLDLPAF